MPADANYDNPAGVFHVTRMIGNGYVRQKRLVVRSRYYFLQDEYKTLRQFYEELRQKDAENGVLRKAESAH